MLGLRRQGSCYDVNGSLDRCWLSHQTETPTVDLKVGSVKVKFLVCNGKACRKAGSEDIICAMEKYCDSFGLKKAKVKAKDCIGICGRAPAMIIVRRKESVLGRIAPADCKDIIRAVRDHEKKLLKRYLVK